MKYLKIATLLTATSLSSIFADDLGPITMQLQLMHEGAQSAERTLEELNHLGRGPTSEIEIAALNVAQSRVSQSDAFFSDAYELATVVSSTSPTLGALLASTVTHIQDQHDLSEQMTPLNEQIVNENTSEEARNEAIQASWKLIQDSNASMRTMNVQIENFFESEPLTDEERERAGNLFEIITGLHPATQPTTH